MDNASNVIIIVDATNAVHEKGQYRKDGKAYLFVFYTKASARRFINNEGLANCVLEERQWEDLVRSFQGSFSRAVVEPRTSDDIRPDMLHFFMVECPFQGRQC